MLKTVVFCLFMGAIGLSLLLPCYAAAHAKIATVAPIGDLAAQIGASINLLDEYLASNESYGQNKGKKIPVEATVVAVLSQAVVESDEKATVAWHAAAGCVPFSGMPKLEKRHERITFFELSDWIGNRARGGPALGA